MRKLKKEVWPYQTTVKSVNESMDKWCKDTLGRRFRDWYDYSSGDGRIYAFKDEATLIIFKLRWSYNG